MDLSPLALWAEMSWFVKGIVLVLVTMSVLTLGISLAKFVRYRKLSSASDAFRSELDEALADDDPDRARSAARSHDESHVARVIGDALDDALPVLRKGSDPERAPEVAHRTVQRRQIEVSSDLKSGLGVLATVGATAPFVGLLGTVIGIVNSFQGIAESGGGGLEAVSAGIAEALVATAIGLLAAIPAVWLYNYFTARVDTLVTRMASTGRELADWFNRKLALDGQDGSVAAAPAGD
jgi:biopolymer transport protein ExbB/biopolymer transport protein TolQ